MASAGAVRAGGAFVEIFANDSKFQQAMTRIQNRLQSVGQTMQRIGTGMSLGGAAVGAPLLLAGRQAAGFEDAILAMRAAADLTDGEIQKLSNAAKSLGTSMGISPTALAKGFTELAKAGMATEKILGGAGKSVAEFSKVSGVEAERAAYFMNSAMSNYGASAQQAVDTLSAAADSSPANIDNLVESFSQIGSVGAEAGWSLFGLSQALGVLADKGIVGEEAGTALKTMVTKLTAPTKDAQEALAELGLAMEDFRDQTGSLLPPQQLAGIFAEAKKAMGDDGFGKVISQKAFTDVFEQRGIKVIAAFTNAGVAGFDAMSRKMSDSLPVSEKFMVMMSGISGQVSRLGTGVEQMSIAFGEAVKGPLKEMTDRLVGMMEVVTKLIQDFPGLATAVAGIAAGLVAVGAAAIAAGIAMRGFAAVTAALSLLAGPKGWIAAVAIGAAIGIIAAEAKMATDELKKAKKAVDDLGKGANQAKAKNATKPDVNRKPMEGDPFAARKAAEELAKEDAAFDEAQGKAIEKLKELQFNIVNEIEDFADAMERSGKEVDGAHEAGFNAAVNFQRDIDDVIRQVEAGIANPQLAEVLAKRAKDTFDADIAQYKKSLEEQTRDFGDSAGTFGNGIGMSIGPRLAKFVKKFTIELRDRGEKAIAAAMPAAGVDPTYGPNPEWLARQAARAKAGADMAAAGAGVAAGGRGGMDAVVNAVREDVKATEEGNAILTKILNNTGKGLAFQ